MLIKVWAEPYTHEIHTGVIWVYVKQYCVVHHHYCKDLYKVIIIWVHYKLALLLFMYPCIYAELLYTKKKKDLALRVAQSIIMNQE